MLKLYKINIFHFQHNDILPNRWDVIALVALILLLAWLAWVAQQMALPYHVGDTIPITLDPHQLPSYALRTVLRMLIAMFFSLLFTFTVGTLAAKNPYAEQMILPLIDILQSVPVLGFLSITIVGFIALFPGSLLGPECAAVFAIFTGQAWNMTLSFYQNLKQVPPELKEAASIFRLSPWQCFWRVETPFAIPGLLWNAMVSMSGSWFYVVASEAISVANQNITLPGIGSYIALAIKTANTHAVLYAILTMLIVILIYDQLLFRPLLCWAEKFKPIQDTPQVEQESWVVDFFIRTRFIRYFFHQLTYVGEWILQRGKIKPNNLKAMTNTPEWISRSFMITWYTVLTLMLCTASYYLIIFIDRAFTLREIAHVFFLGAITGLRVIVLIVLCSCIWIPVGVWVGMRDSLRQSLQPLIQILAAFPANLFFPIVVLMIARFHLNVEIWTAPLMILGSQWYILFNVIAGASALPKDLYLVTRNFNVRGILWWKSFILPGIFPYYITGAITAAGGAWNASIIAEMVTWGNTTYKATGIGAYITEYTALGEFPHIALGISVMCFYVLLLNHLIWRPLYALAQNRFQANT